MVLSSDKVAGLRKPLLMLKLQTTTPDMKQEDALVELDATELAKLITKLKAAQKVSVKLQTPYLCRNIDKFWFMITIQ